MVRPEQSVNSVAILVCLLLVGGCSGHLPNKETIYKSVDDPAFHALQDTLYYGEHKFSGITFLLSPTKDTLTNVPYLDGLKDGYSLRWYDNKQIAERRLYVRGQKEGIHKGWWPNGKLQYEFTIVHDAYSGDYREWNQTGLLIKFFHYVEGQEAGAQKLWYDDGTTRANYLIAGGRRYGLLGTKNCRNVTESVFAK